MQADLVYDVGMNNGDDTAYYLHRGFRVVAIEADPNLCKGAVSRFGKELESGRLQIVNIGIAAKPGVSDFWICEAHSVWNSFDRTISSRNGLPYHRIQVPCQTFGWVLEQCGVPFYLKVDIEGNDFLCIEALQDRADLPAYVSVELGDLDQFVTKLSALGYREFKCVSQFHFLPLQLPPTPEQLALEAGDTSTLRRTRDWVFPEGASGPFGEDTLGRWLDQDEVRRTHAHYSKLRDEQTSTPFWFGASFSFWLDLHARRGMSRAAGV
ncbi:MAG: FkbM family methyltransferase [Mesorhizobium sp.]|uniref:FkbM family methyltransferase n=1 Tax=Mesorhizobium sp. TaxID=1871066 RepID=UPI000FE894BF|nr:FkbM family methyltransferase [Mesorhizobium sp.]RWP25298.1 MAG: FkbM family methyltransferase [Mesorhizobium sp.]